MKCAGEGLKAYRRSQTLRYPDGWDRVLTRLWRVPMGAEGARKQFLISQAKGQRLQYPSFSARCSLLPEMTLEAGFFIVIIFSIIPHC